MTSQDLFYVTLSVCALVVSFLILLNLYYIFRLSRDLRGVSRDLRKKIGDFLGIVDVIREKLEQSVSSAQEITNTAKGVVHFVNELRSGAKEASPGKKRKSGKK
ncbi:MAG: hypothetical protein UW24_C0017G0006 [Parcubacteria group bacterium GW2011_GWA2_44_12]|nr:MAG: hypothetical protein UW24_C0017G0006 [Parcubacteria group bacterium GW2011_GWA2_44_12]